MTYFSFLLYFVVVPIIILAALLVRDRQRGVELPDALQGVSPWLMIALLVLVALLYTTPWDNYLVATRVWWYDPARVTGIVLGWVPIEEYTFFILQPILTGLWLVFLARRVRTDASNTSQPVRAISLGIVGAIWVISVIVLVSGWMPGRYLSIELAWALPPIMLQLFVGAPVLWKNRRLVLLGIITPTLYLSAADTLAISTGIWTIDPAQSLNIFIGGKLPIEELIFFTLTNTLVVLGVLLGMTKEVRSTIGQSIQRLRSVA